METLSYLTDVHGPRLTNSPNMRAAADWTKKRLESYGLSNVALEAWGPFGRGWVNERMLATMTAPQSFPLLAFPKAWTPGTNGLVKGDAVLAVIDKADDFKKWEGKLKGKIVLVSPTREVPAFFASPTRRWEEKALTDLTKPPMDPSRRGRFGPGGPGWLGGATADFRKQRMAFLIKEGVARAGRDVARRSRRQRRRPRPGAARGREPAAADRRRRCCRRSSSPASTTAACCGCSTSRSRSRSSSTSRTASSTPT